MADKIINVKIKEAYDTEANQKTKNPVLLKGQMAISSDTRKITVGDGTHAQLNLPYMNAQHSDSATKATQDDSGNVITSTYATKTELGNKADKSHTHTKDQVGLGNVDNTADKDKNVKHASTADSATKASTADNANAFKGMDIFTGDESGVVYVRPDGVAEVGKYIDFHPNFNNSDQTKNPDYAPRIAARVDNSGVSITGNTHGTFTGNVTGNVTGNLYSKSITGTHQDKIIVLPYVPYELIEPTHNTEKYLKELIKQICVNYPDEGNNATFIGTANPNSAGTVEINIYATSDVNSDGYPRYASGRYNSLNQNFTLFGFYAFDQYYGGPDNAYQATNATNADTAKSLSTVSHRPDSANVKYGDGKLRYFLATSSMSTGKPTFNGTTHDAQIIDLPWDDGGGQDSQIAINNDNGSGQLAVRTQNKGVWQPWHAVYDEGHKPSKSDVGLSKVDNTSDADKPISKATQTALDKKVDKVAGKGLSTNDFTSNYKTKLDGIESGAQKNTVTGVKGNSESNYRTGNINLTADNVGAVSKAGSMMNRKATIQQGNNEDWSKDDPKQTYPVKLGGLCQHEQSDTIDIYAEERARDQLDLVIQLGDDDSNHISIRNHSGSQTAYITPQGEFGGSFKGSLNGQLNSPYDNNLISHGNEFNFEPKFDQDHDVYINYRTQSPNDYKIMKYRFIDGSNAHGYADIQAKTFIGSLSGNASTATKATQDASGNVITSTYATKTELSGKADKSHTHDDRYYTESEINTKLNDKANKSHTHDDRYYTETEINSKLNDIQVGGRNLWKNSKSEKSSTSYTVTNIYYADNIISGEKYTVSLQAKVSTVNNNCKLGVQMNGGNNNVGYFPNLTTDYKKYSFTFTSPINASTSQYSGLYFYPDSSRNGVRVYVKELKLEKGTKVTDQSPAFEDSYGGADTVDGYHASTSATKNTVVVRDNNNYSYFNYINTNVGVDGASTGGAKVTSNSNFLYVNSDGWIRKSARSNFVQALEVLPTSGGTLTGQLKINGAAADKPLMVRGIIGSDGNGTEGELYLNYGVDASIKIGKEGKTYFDSSGIFHGSVTGNVSGNASTATKLQTSRSINGTSFNGSANITTANQGTARNITITDNSGAHSGTATSVNGSQAYTLKMPATISASFIGSLDGNAKTATSATRASQDGNGANIASTYVKKTDLSSSMTVSAMGKDNFLLTADGCLYTSTKTETGFLMITIPHPYKNTGIKFKVSIYTNGDNTPTEYWISGKSSTSFNQVNCGAYSVGKYRNAFSNLPVVFSTDNVYKTLLPVKLIENSKYVANDNGAKLVGETIGTKYGTKCFISIGRSDTKQVSPTVVISDIILNDAVSDFNSWKAGWTMAFTTTQKTGIDVTVNNPNILYDGHASLDLPLSGGTMSGQLNAQYDNNFISHGNEFNFEPKLSKDSEVYINYRTQSSNDYKVTKFHFRDGSNAHAYTDVQAKNFIGNLSGTQNGIIDDHGTANASDTWIPVFNGNKMQHRVSQNIRMSLSGTTLTITA